MKQQNQPIGFIRFDELLNILRALRLTEVCDEKTLTIVAQAVGIGDHFRQQPNFGSLTVELPAYLLERGE